MLLNLTTFLFFRLLMLHPFYVSVCEINFNENNKGLEITHRVFADDLNSHLSEIYNENISFLPKSGFVDEAIQKYLARNFSISVNGKKAEVKYIGYELEEEAIWIYQEVEHAGPLATVSVINTLLMDYQEAQSNIIHFKYQEKIRSHQLTVKQSECQFDGFTKW